MDYTVLAKSIEMLMESVHKPLSEVQSSLLHGSLAGYLYQIELAGLKETLENLEESINDE